MKSIWSNETKIKNRPALNENITTDTVVIGAGMAGILTAFLLQKNGVDCVVLEAKTICSGQTKNTTAKITSQHGIIYSKILKYYGADYAKQFAAANETAIKSYKEIIESENIDCDFIQNKAYLYSLDDYNIIEQEAFAAKQAGISCYTTKETELPFPVANALVFENQAQFNPLKFAQKIAEELRIYENTPVIRIVGNDVITHNAKVTAKNIVVATNYPFINFPGMYFLRISRERSYVLAIKNAGKKINNMHIGTGKKDLSIRSYNDYILIGADSHRTGKNDKQTAYDLLSSKAAEYFPNYKEAARWSAQDCITHDFIPYIGKFSKKASNIYIATGFCKWGMTTSMVSANIISDMICNKHNPYCDVFSPQRFKLSACIGNLCTHISETLMGFASHLKISFSKSESIPINSAKNIMYKSQICGAYRDSDGRIYIVSLKCPHLKCRLNWNETTKTWDCPCHGSRYDYKGNLIDNPSQKESILLEINEKHIISKS